MGATMGARILPRLRNRSVKSLFLLVLVVVIVEMLYKGVTLL
jgi:uncharacterized membrane protein YfcA